MGSKIVQERKDLHKNKNPFTLLFHIGINITMCLKCSFCSPHPPIKKKKKRLFYIQPCVCVCVHARLWHVCLWLSPTSSLSADERILSQWMSGVKRNTILSVLPCYKKKSECFSPFSPFDKSGYI